jgi:hypothetical protein
MTDNVVGLPQGSAQVSSRSAAVAPESPDNNTYTLCDSQFMDDVAQLKALRSFMIRQAKTTQEAWKIELGALNLFRFDAQGRFPYSDEWAELEHRSNELYRHLSEPDRRRFLYGQIPRFVIRTAIFLGIIVLASLVSAVLFIEPILQKHLLFVAFLTWVAALGGIGSIAFIGMNALAIQDDATFDITNKKLIGLRVMLGALFAVVLTLPFGFKSFAHFIEEILKTGGSDPNARSIAMESLLLLLPFVLGFSTTLVIMVLNQFVEAVQSFFGKKASPPPAPPTVVALPSAGGPPHVVSPPTGAPPPVT